MPRAEGTKTESEEVMKKAVVLSEDWDEAIWVDSGEDLVIDQVVGCRSERLCKGFSLLEKSC